MIYDIFFEIITIIMWYIQFCIYILAPIWGGSGTRSPLIFWDTFLRYLRILFHPKKKKMIIMTKIGKKSCPQKGSVPFRLLCCKVKNFLRYAGASIILVHHIVCPPLCPYFIPELVVMLLALVQQHFIVQL